MTRAIGIDVGSTTCKAVAIDEQGAIIASRVEPSSPRIEAQSSALIDVMRHEIGANGEIPVGATGYGRKRVTAAKCLTEITCHARGAYFFLERAGVLIDIGGQDTKVIHINSAGAVADFAMNDKCAAGTGRFLEVILGRLQVPFEGISELIAGAESAVSVSSTCTVFAESEVVSLVARGEAVAGIVKGLHGSLAARVVSLAGRLAPDAELFMSGGVALNPAMVKALSQATGKSITVIDDPQLVGALGAALSVR